MSREKKLLISFLVLLLLQFCTPKDTITLNQSLKDVDLLVSGNETFALGFFSPGKSRNRYLGIWYNKVTELTLVWVANQDNTISNTSEVVSVDSFRKLVIHGPDKVIPVWSTNVCGAAHSAQLLDSGNLVMLGGDDYVERSSPPLLNFSESSE